MDDRLKKITTPRELLKNITWLSILLVGGYYILSLMNPYKHSLDIIRDPGQEVLSQESILCATIISVVKDRGTAYVELDNSQIISIRPSRNYEYKIPWLDDFLQVGDYLKKEAGSDTLWIKRNGKLYYFVIGEFINKKK